jgi:nitrogen fixation protein NifU and related proteins
MDLYHPLILKYAREPIGFEKRLSAQMVKEARNPLCGDKFTIYMDFNRDVIEKITFHGYGCAVSKATAAVLVEKMSGKSAEKAREICQIYLTMFDGGALTHDETLNIFEMARHVSGRTTCATLVWEAFQQILLDKQNE